MPQQLDGRYEILKPLGSGGFGKTYLARDLRIPGTPYCVVKQLHCTSYKPADKQLARELFQREAESLAQLGHHDQIPRLLAYFTENDEFYLVEDFIDGRSLEDEIQAGQPWSEASVVHLLRDVLEVLSFVHAQGVIHRDIKPANLIRRHQDGKIVLIDFGAIKQIGQGQLSEVHKTGTQIGTAGYMPPEQAQGKPRPNSDIYAIGVVAISALTGHPVMGLPDDPQTGEIQWQYLVPVSPGLAQILTQMVRYYFQNRYQHVEEVQQALKQLFQGVMTPQMGVPKAPPPAIPPVGATGAGATQVAAPVANSQSSFSSGETSSRRSPWLLGVGLAILIPLLGGAAAFLFNARTSLTTPTQSPATDDDQPCTAVVVGNIRSERTAYRGNGNILLTGQGRSFEVGTQETRGGWIQIKLPSGQIAWTHLDVVANESALKSCLQTKNIALKMIADIPPPPPPPQPEPAPTLPPPETEPPEDESETLPEENETPPQSEEGIELVEPEETPDESNEPEPQQDDVHDVTPIDESLLEETTSPDEPRSESEPSSTDSPESVPPDNPSTEE